MEEPRPIVPRGRHPIETGKYKLPTRAIEDTVNVVYQWIQNCIPGGVIYGGTRVGKTKALEYIVPRIPEFFGGSVPAHIIPCEDLSQASRGEFYENILRALNHGFASSGTPGRKKGRLVQFLEDEAYRSGDDRVILFFDDAQWLKEIEFNWLMALHNDLNLKEITLHTILVGQRELLARRSMFIRSDGMQIVGRFMTCSYQFHGIRNLLDMKVALRGYDDLSSEYPIGSGWSLTRYWVPKAFDNGWRLEQQAVVIAEAFQELKREANLKLPEIPMQSFAPFVAALLRDIADMDQPNLVLDLGHLLESLGHVVMAQLEQHEIANRDAVTEKAATEDA